MLFNKARPSLINLVFLIVPSLNGMHTQTLAETNSAVTPVSYDHIFQPEIEFSVNSTSVPVYNAYKSSTDSEVASYRGTFRLRQFSNTGTVSVTITDKGPDPISTSEINPKSSIANATRNGKQIAFSLASSMNGLSQPLEIQINNNNPQDRWGIDPITGLKVFGTATRLYILADAPEVTPPTGSSGTTLDPSDCKMIS